MEPTANTTDAPYTPAATKPVTETDAPNELARLRDLLIHTHPDAVAGMIAGHSVTELIESVAAAKAEYARIAARLHAAAPVRAGGGSRSSTLPAPDLARLSPIAKITLGIHDRTSQ